jgi:hypothetical protein
MVEIRIEEMFGSTETDQKITSEPWSSMQRTKKTTKTTLRSERSSALEKDLTEPTSLEMCRFGLNHDFSETHQARFTSNLLEGGRSTLATPPPKVAGFRSNMGT